MKNTHEHPILSVTQLNQQVKYLLEQSFPLILVEGEISNFVCPSSGHWYFSLKDKNAQIRCAMFRMHNRKINFKVESGTQILLKARVSLYEARGDFQLIVEDMEEAGLGALQKAFDALKHQLEKEGLFAEKHKKFLPEIPETIGVITSATGAAVQDVLRVLNRRYPAMRVIIYPTLVQGDQAAKQIVKAIKTANQRDECDLLILTRGGGSLEDLWPFNEESVARAIFNSQLPIVSGVGHQIDFTIADFVADVRAATPSAAAELISPDQEALLEQLKEYERTLVKQILQKQQSLNQAVDWLQKRLLQLHPAKKIKHQQQQLLQLKKQLIEKQQNQINSLKSQLAALARTLNAISPLATLERGYAVVKCAGNDKLIKSKKDIKVGEQAIIKLYKDELLCTVDQIN